MIGNLSTDHENALTRMTFTKGAEDHKAVYNEDQKKV